MPDTLHLEQEARLRRLPRKPKKPLPHYTQLLVPGLAIGSGLLLTTALPNLIGADSLVDLGKCALIGATATATAYGVNRLAIERGARQAAIGTRGAATLSAGTMAAIGLGFFTATYSGFTVDAVDRLRLEEFGTAQAAYVEAQQTALMEAARVVPPVDSLVAEFADKHACEVAESCLSGRGNGGKGSYARALQVEAGRAAQIKAILDEQADRLIMGLGEINAAQDDYQGVLADDLLTGEDRRVAARNAVMRIGQTVSALAQNDRVGLVAAYAEELARDSGAPPEVERLRQARAAQLQSIAASVPKATITPPRFPTQSGVSDTLLWTWHFLPIALIVAVVELIFPVTLWLYTTFALLARLEEDDPAETNSEPVRRNGHDRPRAGR